MKKNTLLTLLAAFTIIAIIWHTSTRTETVDNTLLIRYSGTEHTLPLSDIPLMSISGEVVNGKGEVRKVDASGSLLADVLIDAGIPVDSISKVTVTASDEYSAVLSGDEVRAADTACLIVNLDGSMQLIAFGDPDSRRNVTDVVRLDVE